jgi:hypothetical protein
MPVTNQSINCFRYRNFTMKNDLPYCTLTEHKCKFQDYTHTTECEMYSSGSGETVDLLPRCTRPDITDKFSEKTSHLHNHEAKLRKRP